MLRQALGTNPHFVCLLMEIGYIPATFLYILDLNIVEDVPELKLFKRLAEALGETVENVANLNSWERDNLLHGKQAFLIVEPQ